MDVSLRLLRAFRLPGVGVGVLVVCASALVCWWIRRHRRTKRMRTEKDDESESVAKKNTFSEAHDLAQDDGSKRDKRKRLLVKAREQIQQYVDLLQDCTDGDLEGKSRTTQGSKRRLMRDSDVNMDNIVTLERKISKVLDKMETKYGDKWLRKVKDNRLKEAQEFLEKLSVGGSQECTHTVKPDPGVLGKHLAEMRDQLEFYEARSKVASEKAQRVGEVFENLRKRVDRLKFEKAAKELALETANGELALAKDEMEAVLRRKDTLIAQNYEVAAKVTRLASDLTEMRKQSFEVQPFFQEKGEEWEEMKSAVQRIESEISERKRVVEELSRIETLLKGEVREHASKQPDDAQLPDV